MSGLDAGVKLNCFKAYDVRARVPEELNTEIAYRIGRAYAEVVKPVKVVVGFDIRLTSPELADAVTRGLLDSGVDVYEIGLCGTEEVYFATSFYQMDGGMMVTASHNPMEYNGIKFVREESRPISGDNGLKEIESLVESGRFVDNERGGTRYVLSVRSDYLRHLLEYIDVEGLSPLKIVVDAGNGGAGQVIDLLEQYLPFEFIKLNNTPDGHFPNGVPNPLIPENRDSVIACIKDCGADLGIAWDGDFDRCFLFDEQGTFVEGYYIVGLLAEAFLQKYQGEKIIHDPRLTWNTIDVVEDNGGKPIQSKTGHAFIKDIMRRENAIYGGEMSGHHYFRNFFYCDSGMIPWLLAVELMVKSGKPLSELVGERMKAFPCSGELNFRVEDADRSIEKVVGKYKPSCTSIDYTDGVSLEFNSWRMNIRPSNTEPVLRLNVETRGDPDLLDMRTKEVSSLIRGW